MGHAKADLPFGDETMLQRVVRLLRQVVEPIVVVSAHGDDRPEVDSSLQDVLWTRDQRPDRGPLEGISAGLHALAENSDCQAAYITSCDVPLLQPAFVEQLMQHLPQHDIVVPREDRFHHPLAALYRVEVRTVVDRLLEHDQLRPAFLFDLVRTRHVDVETLRTADPELATLQNLNRPQDYLAALAKQGLPPPEQFDS